MALVCNSDIHSTGSSIVYMLILDCLGRWTTQNTEYCVALCYYKGGHSLPWSQPSWIHRWIVVINLNGPNGSQRSTWSGHPHTVTNSSESLDSVTVSDSASLETLVKCASKIIGLTLPTIESVYHIRCMLKSKNCARCNSSSQPSRQPLQKRKS